MPLLSFAIQSCVLMCFFQNLPRTASGPWKEINLNFISMVCISSFSSCASGGDQLNAVMNIGP